MGCLMVMVVLAIQVMLLLCPAAASLFDGTCDGVECGMGRCEVASGGNKTLLGYVCECEVGWTQIGFDDNRLQFLPCIIPNCTLNYSCAIDSSHLSEKPFQAPPNMSLFDPCFWSYCGGGDCVASSSGFGHRCECKEGFINLLNMTSLPCFKDCIVGADCPNLGFTLLNASFPSSPPYFVDTGASPTVNSVVWALVLSISAAMMRAKEVYG